MANESYVNKQVFKHENVSLNFSKQHILINHWQVDMYTPPKKYPDTLPISSIKRLFWNRNLKMIPSEYSYITYLILKVLNRPLKWGTARLWTPTGWKNTSRQKWTFEKNLSFSTCLCTLTGSSSNFDFKKAVL